MNKKTPKGFSDLLHLEEIRKISLVLYTFINTKNNVYKYYAIFHKYQNFLGSILAVVLGLY